MTELNDLNRKIRSALGINPDLRKATLKLATAHYAGELTNYVLDGLLDIILASHVARPTTRRLLPRLVLPLLRLLSCMTAYPDRHYCHISEFTDLRATDVSLLRFWGLVEVDPIQRGYYTLTRMFFHWAVGNIRIPSTLVFNGGGAAVKYQPGPDMVSIASVLDEVGWLGEDWNPSREQIHQWLLGPVNRLRLCSRDWCGGIENTGATCINADLQELLTRGATIVQRSKEAMGQYSPDVIMEYQ